MNETIDRAFENYLNGNLSDVRSLIEGLPPLQAAYVGLRLLDLAADYDLCEGRADGNTCDNLRNLLARWAE